MVIANDAVAMFALRSSVEQVTRVRPTGKRVPDLGALTEARRAYERKGHVPGTARVREELGRLGAGDPSL